MQTKKTVIAGFGEILWDLLPSGKQLGGAPANFAYHCGALGSEAYPVSCIGKDESGREILNLLRGKGVSDNYIAVDEEHPTGTVAVSLGSGGIPSYVIHEQVAWDFIPLDEKMTTLASRLDAVCFGSLSQRSETSRETLNLFLESLNPRCLKVFDINLRQHYFTAEMIKESLIKSNILKLNDGELEILTDLLELTGKEKEKLSQLLNRYHLQLVALTKGEKGSVLMTPSEFSETVAPQVKIADTVGAGDAFTAALTVGRLMKEPLPKIHQHANRLAAWVCSCHGAMPPLPVGFM
jgi:fructokinase